MATRKSTSKSASKTAAAKLAAPPEATEASASPEVPEATESGVGEVIDDASLPSPPEGANLRGKSQNQAWRNTPEHLLLAARFRRFNKRGQGAATDIGKWIAGDAAAVEATPEREPDEALKAAESAVVDALTACDLAAKAIEALGTEWRPTLPERKRASGGSKRKAPIEKGMVVRVTDKHAAPLLKIEFPSVDLTNLTVIAVEGTSIACQSNSEPDSKRPLVWSRNEVEIMAAADADAAE